MKKEKSKLHPEVLKMYNSSVYRKRIKRIVESIKTLRNIPHGTKLPGRPNQLKKTASEAEIAAAAKINNYRIDRQAAHDWARYSEVPMDRRIQKQSSDTEE